MGTKKRWWLLILIVWFGLGGNAEALDSRYERNGEVYLLVGSGIAGKRGVYRLNNPSGEPSGLPFSNVTPLYDPTDSVGIAPDLQRRVFTFSQETDAGFTLAPGLLRRRLKPQGGCTLFGAHVDTRVRVTVDIANDYPALHDSDGTINGRQASHDWPVYTTTGTWGNWGGVNNNLDKWIAWSDRGRFWSTNNVYAGPGNPVQTRVDPVTGYTGWRFISDCCPGGWNGKAGCDFYVYWVPVDGAGWGMIPNNSWWQGRDPDPPPRNRPGNLFFWDRLWEKRTWYNLKEYVQSRDGIGESARPGGGTNHVDYIAREYLVRYWTSACINVVCVAGGAPQMTEPTPKHICSALSAFGRIYLYSRTVGGTDAKLKMNGSEVSLTGANCRGDANHASTQWVGISTQSPSSDYVYFLGTKTFQDWIPGLSATAWKADAVSVSDQWNLEGGIVFGYDKDLGIAYQVIRNDKSGNNSVVGTPRRLDLGPDCDDLKSDGFGNAYFAKTVYTPATSSITINDCSGVTVQDLYAGRHRGTAYYAQSVDKRVFRRGFNDTAITTINTVNLGSNIFFRDFDITPALAAGLNSTNIVTRSSDPDWIWIHAAVQPPLSTVGKPDTTQLGVINVGSPPRVEGATDSAVIDIVGPASQPILINTARSTDPNVGYDQGAYTFRVENAPRWDGLNNVVLPGKIDWQGDLNGNGQTGQYCSTLANSEPDQVIRQYASPEVTYDWLVIRVQDAIGMATRTEVLSKPASTRNRLSYYFSPGVYEIHCAAQYKWYDYDMLSFGSTIASRGECLKGPTRAYGPNNLSDFTGISGFVGPTDPTRTAVQVIKIKQGQPPPPARTVAIHQSRSSSFSPPVIAKNGTVGGQSVKYFVATQSLDYYYRLDPAADPAGVAMVWSLTSLKTYLNDINMIEGSLQWTSDAQFNWEYKVTMPNGDPGPAQTFNVSFRNGPPSDNVCYNLPLEMPTDPTLGTISCRLIRTYIYDRKTYDSDEEGNPILAEPVQIDGTLSYGGDARILVLDSEPPQIVKVNGSTGFLSNPSAEPLLLGKTLGQVTENLTGEYAGYTYPGKFSFLVRDNNPFNNEDDALGAGIPEARQNRRTKMTGQFFFEKGAAKARSEANPGIEGRYYFSPGLGTVEEGATGGATYMVKRTKQPYVRDPGGYYSEVLYEFDLVNWKHVQDMDPGTFPNHRRAGNRWQVDFANNQSNYNAGGGIIGANHPGFAVGFQATDASGNAMPNVTPCGTVWLRDSLAPVPCIQYRDFHSNSITVPLANLFHDGENAAASLTYEVISDASTWAVDATNKNFVREGTTTSVFPGKTIRGIPWGLTAAWSETDYVPPRSQQGIEVFLTPSAEDNIGVYRNYTAGGFESYVPKVTITGPISGALYYPTEETSVAALDPNNTVGLPRDGVTNLRTLRTILQYPGVYNLELTAHDTAMNFAGAYTPNKRTVKCAIVVAPTKMIIRTLGNKNQRF